MVWMQNFEFNHKFVAMIWCPLSTKGQGALDHRNGELVGKNFMVSQILKKLIELKGEACTKDGRRCSKPSRPNWKPCVLLIPSIANVWCTRCKLKALIASQARLDWWGRPLKWMTGKKHVSNDQWKPWHPHSNIQVSSNSLPSTQRPWRHTHYGGMGELFEKCWFTTQSTTPLLIIIPHYSEGG